MKPASPVIRESSIDLNEVKVAEHQPEFNTLPAIVLECEDGRRFLTRWELDDEDRARIAAGGSIYLTIMGKQIQPVHLGTVHPQLSILAEVNGEPAMIEIPEAP